MIIVKDAAGEVIEFMIEPSDTVDEIAAMTHMTSRELCRKIQKCINLHEKELDRRKANEKD